MISKKKIVLTLITLTFILGFESLHLTRLGAIAGILLMGLSAVGYVIFVYYFKQFPKTIRWFGIGFILLYILSITTTHQIYGQSYKIGVYSNMSLFYSGAAFLVYFLLVRFRIEAEDLKKSLLAGSWVVFVGFTLFHFYALAAPGTVQVAHFEGVSFLQKGMINLGTMIYITYFFEKNHLKYLLFAVLLYSFNHWSDFQRYIFVAFLMSIALMALAYKRNNAGIRIIAILVLVVPVLVTAISATPMGQKVYDKLSSVTELFESNRDDFSDESVGARVKQAEYAISMIREYPITGVGRIHNTKKEAYTGEEHFFAVDIGLLGVLYTYGIFGVLLFLFQVRYFLMNHIRNRFTSIPHTIGYKLFLFYLLLHTLATGSIVHGPFKFLVIVAIIEFCRLTYLKRSKTIEQTA